MTTSSTTSFNLNRNQIIEEAFKLIGVLTPGRALTNYELQDAVISFNLMIKGWIAQGRYIWKTDEGVLFPVPSQGIYVLDGSSSNATNSYVTSTLNANVNSGATTIELVDATGFIVGYYIGIYTDNNTIFWTTISAISGTTITLTDALNQDCSSGNYVFAYQTNISRPEGIISATWRTLSSNSTYNDIPMQEISLLEYQQLTNKQTTGNPIMFYYNKQLTYGSVYLWPQPANTNGVFQFNYETQFYDAGIATDNPDFPVEWLETLIYNLAYRLAIKYRIGAERTAQIKEFADESFQNLEGYDRERYTSLFFQPNFY